MKINHSIQTHNRNRLLPPSLTLDTWLLLSLIMHMMTSEGISTSTGYVNSENSWVQQLVIWISILFAIVISLIFLSFFLIFSIIVSNQFFERNPQAFRHFYECSYCISYLMVHKEPTLDLGNFSFPFLVISFI